MDMVVRSKVIDFFSRYKQQVYKKGEILIRADDTPSGIFYLIAGTVREYAISAKGDEVVINIFKPGSYFPMSWAMNGTKNEYFYEAITPLQVSKAPKADTLKFITDNPDILYDLLSRVYRGMDGVLTRMIHLMSGSAYIRLITELVIYAKRFGVGNDEISIEISEKDLAAQSGMTRETVSREMKILKDRNLVHSINGKLVIGDLRKLNEELLHG